MRGKTNKETTQYHFRSARLRHYPFPLAFWVSPDLHPTFWSYHHTRWAKLWLWPRNAWNATISRSRSAKLVYQGPMHQIHHIHSLVNAYRTIPAASSKLQTQMLGSKSNISYWLASINKFGSIHPLGQSFSTSASTFFWKQNKRKKKRPWEICSVVALFLSYRFSPIQSLYDHMKLMQEYLHTPVEPKQVSFFWGHKSSPYKHTHSSFPPSDTHTYTHHTDPSCAFHSAVCFHWPPCISHTLIDWSDEHVANLFP